MILAPFLLLCAPLSALVGGLWAPQTADEQRSSAQGPEQTEPFERRARMMGTQLRIRIFDSERPEALLASEAVMAALDASEARLSNWNPDSEISRFLATPIDTPVELSAELARDLRAALALHAETGGSFHPCLGALIDAWDLEGEGRHPSRAAIQDTFPLCRAGDLVETRHGWLRRSALTVATGGFGKGAGLRDAQRALQEAGIERAEVDLGGQWLLHGGPDARFEVDVAHPVERSKTWATLRVPEGSIATSGNSERARIVDGRQIGHLLDPRTGQPAEDFGSVTVWSSDALRADALATALFVLGPEQGLALAERLPDVEALFIVRTAAGWKTLATPTWEVQLRKSDPSELNEESPPANPRHLSFSSTPPL